MRTLAIGDIHGCFKALQAVVAAAQISSDDNIVTLGDYVDRGPEVPEVLAWLRTRYQLGCLTPLLGNHEIMMRASRKDESLREEWLEFGGTPLIFGGLKHLYSFPVFGSILAVVLSSNPQ